MVSTVLLKVYSEGKTFIPAPEIFDKIAEYHGTAVYSEIIEDNALIRYSDKEFIAIIKGVSDSYPKLNNIGDRIVDGEFSLHKDNRPLAVAGYGVASSLEIGLNFIDPLIIYVPDRKAKGGISLEGSTNREIIYPSGIFSIQQDIDSKFVIVPIDFARKLFDYPDQISSVEIRIKDNYDIDKAIKDISMIAGPEFRVRNRFQQQELMYKTIKSEKLMGFIILAFILAIASFNIIGSLTMLIIDKENDISTLKSMGASNTDIRRIFLFEGWLISVSGAIAGIALGLLLCFLQDYFGLIPLYGSGSFIVDSYPVEVNIYDILYVFITVVTIGFLAAQYPVKYLARRIK